VPPLDRATERLAVDAFLANARCAAPSAYFPPHDDAAEHGHDERLPKGRRIGLIAAELTQSGNPVARLRALFAQPRLDPMDRFGRPRIRATARRYAAHTRRTLLLDNSDHRGWTPHVADHLGGAHKQTWNFRFQLLGARNPRASKWAAASPLSRTW
jgi:hypothetical protein